jgi:hypothetical protein
MVGGRKVLLSIAVLTGLGFDSVLGGQHPPGKKIQFEVLGADTHRQVDFDARMGPLIRSRTPPAPPVPARQVKRTWCLYLSRHRR